MPDGSINKRAFLTAGVGVGISTILSACGSRQQVQGIRYQVSPGDTMDKVAWMSGLSQDKIRSFNKLASDDLKAGQILLFAWGVYVAFISFVSRTSPRSTSSVALRAGCPAWRFGCGAA